MEHLGNGVLAHQANQALRLALESGALSRQAFHEELLRLVYRFLFLFTAEDRELLFSQEVGKEDPRRQIYREGYSLGRLRELVLKRSAYEGNYGDLWQLQRLVFQQLSISNSPLGLPGLGGLFDTKQCPNLQACELDNRYLLRAIKAIGWFEAGGTLTRVNYRDLNTEELGSVYEGLLELHPQVEQVGSRMQLSYGAAAGSDRKTTGSYYTPDELVKLLIESALLPVIQERLSKAPTIEAKIQALLAIRVLDPACGSGHFLLAAGRRLALELARLRAGDDEPSEALRQQCLREVVAHCLYGVDKNPMAVELCKVALWIEAIDPGKPLSFLDAHIQCGDSLVGVFDPKVLEEGIPEEAYKPLTGDDKTVCTSLKKDNATARRNISRRGSNRGVQGSLDLSGSKPRSPGQSRLQAIEAMPETSLPETAAKQAAYADWLQETGSDPETLAAHLYTAALFLPKTAESRAQVPTTEHLLKLLGGQPISEVMEQAVQESARNFCFLHWHLRFGEVMATGGFDCVLGNPPWETMSPDVKEWFATYNPEIRNNSPEGQREIKEGLLVNPAIKEGWESHCNQLYSAANFIKTSSRYTLFAPGNLGKGDFNTYRFFVELSLSLCADNGVAGMVVPENLYNGANAMALRRELTERRGPLILRGFENTKNHWFEDIDSRSKFCLFVSPPRPVGDHGIDAAFCIRTDQQLKELPSKVVIPAWVNKEIGGDALAIPEIRSNLEVEILERLYAAYPRFSDGYAKLPGGRPYAAEVHMGNDRDMFTEDASAIPLYEGKMVDQYDYRAKAYVSGRGRSAVWQELAFGSPEKRIAPQWRVKKSSLNGGDLERIRIYRLGFCDVTSPTNQRSLVAAIIPPSVVCGHKVPTIQLGHELASQSLLWLAIANSLSIDFLVRKKVSLQMSYTILDTLPLPVKKPETKPEISITRLAASLALTGALMGEFAEQFAAEDPGWNGELLVNEDERHYAKAEIEAIYAIRILNLTRAQMQFILRPKDISDEYAEYETFGALERAEIRQFGEYRTQRLVMEAWDRLFGGGRSHCSA
ncbi:MAG: N-6 DNA methylase [Synechococcaceae cyanobacterium ELA182]